MNNKKIYKNIVEILSTKYKIKKEEIKSEAIFMEDIKLDSFQLLLFVSDIEKLFGIEFDEDELLKMQTVNDFCSLIEKTTNKNTNNK